jgi:hemolysin III
MRMLWLDSPRSLTSAVYIVVGWAAVLALPPLYRALGVPSFSLVVLGGVLYTAGAVVFARRRPDPRPEVFGYHEVFHSFVVAAALCHVIAVAILVRRR